MPITAIRCPKTGSEISFEDAPDHFERLGIMPAEQVQAMIDQENQHRRMGTSLSPSILDPSVNCRREIALKKLVDYILDPTEMWEANEGTIWHAAIRAAGANVPGWQRELLLPNESHEGHPAVRRDERGVLEMEIFPGIWVNGMLDGLNDLATIIKDLKTKNYPYLRAGKDATPTEYPLNDEWVTQLNVYRRMVEILYHDGAEGGVKELRLWRQYRGSRRRDLTFKCFGYQQDAEGVEHDTSIPILTNAELESRIRTHNDTTVSWLCRALAARRAAEAAGEDAREAVLKIIDEIPMDGIPMFRGQKCPKFCSVQKICFGRSGLAVF